MTKVVMFLLNVVTLMTKVVMFLLNVVTLMTKVVMFLLNVVMLMTVKTLMHPTGMTQLKWCISLTLVEWASRPSGAG
ncbi:hypothetical protein FACHB389_13135 [Nostoc calcicola FACHB-389]|nr:hypothetical protein FACHB389_13135 [Nostoc calcicola FACHB-389]